MTESEIAQNIPSLERAPDLHFDHRFKGFWSIASECDIQIWKTEKLAFVLLTDIGKGTSVTNAAEIIIASVYDQWLSKTYTREQCIFAETYQKKEGIDIIIPKWDGHQVSSVTWKHLGKII